MAEITPKTILGIKIDQVTMDQAVELIEGWLKERSKRYIVTPNVEFIMAAGNDSAFKAILNQADLSIPDSARLGWAQKVLSVKHKVGRILLLPFVFIPRLISGFPVTTGTDLMERLCEVSAEKGYTVGLLGGRDNVAVKTAECLKQRFTGLKIAFAEAGPQVDREGNSDLAWRQAGFRIQDSELECDILFVAFGQVKQEKWIVKNLDKLDVKVAMGVGGAFDYLSNNVPRAPLLLRKLGFEWLFRLMIQPWRIKRQLALIKFVWLVLKS